MWSNFSAKHLTNFHSHQCQDMVTLCVSILCAFAWLSVHFIVMNTLMCNPEFSAFCNDCFYFDVVSISSIYFDTVNRLDL